MSELIRRLAPVLGALRLGRPHCCVLVGCGVVGCGVVGCGVGGSVGDSVGFLLGSGVGLSVGLLVGLGVGTSLEGVGVSGLLVVSSFLIMA